MYKVVFWWVTGTGPRLEGVRERNSYQKERATERANWMNYDSWRREAITQRQLKTKFPLLSVFFSLNLSLRIHECSPWLNSTRSHRARELLDTVYVGQQCMTQGGEMQGRAWHGMAEHGRIMEDIYVPCIRNICGIWSRLLRLTAHAESEALLLEPRNQQATETMSHPLSFVPF